MPNKTKHSDDCNFKDFHESLWHRLNEWEYELVVDEDGIYYGVKRYESLNDIHPKRHSSEFIDFKFCPVCGAEIEKDDSE